jgi:hypothetical protein
VVEISPRSITSRADTETEFPPLSLEKELLIPPVERVSRAERSILVLLETLLGMMPQEGKEVVKIKDPATSIKTGTKRIYTICNFLEGL